MFLDASCFKHIHVAAAQGQRTQTMARDKDLSLARFIRDETSVKSYPSCTI